MDKEAVKELIQDDFNKKNLKTELTHILDDSYREEMFLNYFPEPKKLEKENERTPYSDLLDWFVLNPMIELPNGVNDEEYNSILNSIEPLQKLIEEYCPDLPETENSFMKEIILWALVEFQRLDKKESASVFQFQTAIFNTGRGYREV